MILASNEDILIQASLMYLKKIKCTKIRKGCVLFNLVQLADSKFLCSKFQAANLNRLTKVNRKQRFSNPSNNFRCNSIIELALNIGLIVFWYERFCSSYNFQVTSIKITINVSFLSWNRLHTPTYGLCYILNLPLCSWKLFLYIGLFINLLYILYLLPLPINYSHNSSLPTFYLMYYCT